MAILPIGFFMPLPLAMMIPFMGMQSAVMMKQAGENWQYGKRLQSSLTNEEFNKQTQVTIFERNQAEIRQMIPTMEQSIKDMRGFQDFIIVELIELMRRGLETGLGAIFGLTPEQSNEFFGGTNPPSLSESTPPIGITTPEGITLSIEQIQAMSVNTLLFETQASQITKYTEATQAHLLTEKLARNIQDTGTEENIQSALDVRTVLFKAESQFLIWLSSIDLVAAKGGAFNNDANLVRKLETNFGDFTLRTRSSASDERLQQYRDGLLLNRNVLIGMLDANAINPGTSTQGSIESQQGVINTIHVMIWIHQLVYSR